MNGLAARVAGLVDDRPAEGVFRLHRDVFRDEALFELEIRHIFESTWVFLGLESELPKPHDYLTTRIGRQPVVVMRAGDGTLGAFINSCRHRGATICHLERGNKRIHTCTYHGWAYDSGGKCVLVTDEAQGCYTDAFTTQKHDLAALAKFGNYRGFLFGSLSAEVPPLEEHLGASRAFLDLFVDQGPQGLEAVPGRVTFTFGANWKTQIENATDSYHFSSTHASYIGVLGRRGARAAEQEKPAQPEAPSAYASINRTQAQLERGSFDLGRGHSVLYGPIPDPTARPLHMYFDEVRARVGEVRAKWMQYMRNMTVFPNLQLSENIAPQLRILRPLAVGLTEMTTYCVGPKGEAKDARRRRIRHYEEFFNPSGLATPDDVATYQDCQAGFEGHAIEWQQGYARGMAVLKQGADEHAKELGIEPQSSMYGPFRIGDETCHQSAYREWRRLILRGLARG
jgi:phenylpropionate dioxygenase-like ring-hydroxylating dioxygenase large terminal subunit